MANVHSLAETHSEVARQWHTKKNGHLTPNDVTPEQYSNNKEQSYNLYPSYEDWINGYIRKTFQIRYDLLKPNGILLLNIADTKELSLELDTLGVLEEIGFEFQYEIGMKMQRYLSIDTEKIYNRYYDEDKKKYVKVEPILKFVKNE